MQFLENYPPNNTPITIQIEELIILKSFVCWDIYIEESKSNDEQNLTIIDVINWRHCLFLLFCLRSLCRNNKKNIFICGERIRFSVFSHCVYVGLNCEIYSFLGWTERSSTDKLHISFYASSFFEEGLKRRQKKAIFPSLWC